MYTSIEREQELSSIFEGLLKKYEITYKLNKVPVFGNSPIVLDVEHDESGNFVCCGILVLGDSHVYCLSDIHALRRIDFLPLSIIAHNGKGDLELLRSWGIDVKDEQLTHDTMLFGHIIDSSLKVYGLKDMAKRELQIEYPSYDDIVGKRTAKQSTPRRTLDEWPIEIVAMYNTMDVYVTGEIAKRQLKHRSNINCDYYVDLVRPCSLVWSQMEARGTRVDLKYLTTLKNELEGLQTPIKEAIVKELGPINLNSPKQLLEALHAKGIKPDLKGKPSTDKNALGKLKEIPVVQRLLEFSEIDTLLSSFCTPYLERGQEIVHPFFNQCGTRTGRPSCSNPNLLQIPKRTENGKKVRRMFIPRPRMVMGDCDYGQIEPRVLAHQSKDPVLCDMFNKGIDFHTFTSERMGIDRQRAKVLNLSVGYRATKYSVSRQLGGSLEEAQEEINRWWAMFPGLRRWQERLIFESKRSGFCTTLLGRRIRVDGLNESLPWKREAAERQLINNIAQGSAAEIMQRAMIGIRQDFSLHPQFGLLIQVYDELVWESPDPTDLGIVTENMENAVKLDVPLVVEGGIGPNWADIKGA